jgi:hypothetical protein
MAINHEQGGLARLIRVDAQPPLLTLPNITIDAPECAEYFAEIPEEDRVGELQSVIEMGVQGRKAVRTNATVREIEARLLGVAGQLDGQLRERLADDRKVTREELAALLVDHRTRLSEGLVRYLDPESTASVPVAMAKALEDIVENLYKRVDGLLADGDESALGRLGDRVVKEIQQAAIAVVEQTSARHALVTRSALSGRPYEDDVLEHVIRLTRPTRDTVVRVTDTPGLTKRKTGDIVVELDEASTGGHPARIVLEVKRRSEGTDAFSAQAILTTLEASCRNRGADMAIFVTESATLLPAGIGYRELAPGRIAVAFEPGGDDTALAVAIGVLRSQLLVSLARGGDYDVDAVLAALAALRQWIGNLEQVRSHHEGARRSIDKATCGLDEIRQGVLTRLAKLEALVTP